ncbi:hypothetical protein Ctha_1186 [Chloroherpeton thalassium ATCC 35110]|uniref:Lipoprotein n=1 Tax=Chloroherpeton thalassium (strain ATCC 35110 / GB-78) TaxID=517418 RepID=B3QYM2_CHLT3|nr:hypothetical protein [Chloroherpeton thalassium]ACF13650.1 hypothetical protein Ctha_1186 [Chloroherpeton thalassium ATCC 35110]
MNLFRYYLIFFLLVVVGAAISMSGCGSSTPLDRLKSELNQYPEYTIVLQDMKQDGAIFPKYFHNYKLIYAEPDAQNADSLVYLSSQTGWQEVPEDFYKENQNYLGMTLASKTRDGKVSEDKFPPGYQYIGNPQYGQWRQNSDGTSFWEFYGKYAMMRDAFGLIGSLISRNDYDDYRSYRRSSQPFFGSPRQYGTFGSKTQQAAPSFFERKKAQQQEQRSSFLSKFKSRVSRGTQSTFRSRSSGSFGK